MAIPRQLPSGKWRAQYLDHAGKRCSVTRKTKAAAEKELRKRQVLAEEVRDGRADPPVPTSPVLSAFVEDTWIKRYPTAAKRVGKLAPMTLRSIESHIELHITPLLGGRRLDAIDAVALDAFVSALRTGHGEQDALGEKSIRNVLGTLGTILHSARRWKQLASVPELPAVKIGEQISDFFTDVESALLFAAARNDLERALLIFAIQTGARAGEQRVIEWGDIDWQSRKVMIRRALACNATEVGTPKSGHERTVPMSATLIAALQAIRPVPARGLIFHNADGRPYSNFQLHERLWWCCRKAGLREIRWHDLRHSFGTQAAAAGVPLRTIQAWMGHSTIRMTERYAKYAPGGDAAIAFFDRPVHTTCTQDRSAA